MVGADAREWIQLAAPDHPSLIDEWHVTTELSGMVNVRNCVWIDEYGAVVCSPHPADMTDVARKVGPEGWMLEWDAWGLLNLRDEGTETISPRSKLLDGFWAAVNARGDEPFYAETRLD
jgi:hypothetical protein